MQITHEAERHLSRSKKDDDEDEDDDKGSSREGIYFYQTNCIFETVWKVVKMYLNDLKTIFTSIWGIFIIFYE